MKKKRGDGNTLTPAVDGRSPRRDQRLRSAIETVFRLTHRRDMTAKERKDFGLNPSNSNHKEPKRKEAKVPKRQPVAPSES